VSKVGTVVSRTYSNNGNQPILKMRHLSETCKVKLEKFTVGEFVLTIAQNVYDWYETFEDDGVGSLRF
jgi:hypothetical protein